jgi:hypothetical protein
LKNKQNSKAARNWLDWNFLAEKTQSHQNSACPKPYANKLLPAPYQKACSPPPSCYTTSAVVLLSQSHLSLTLPSSNGGLALHAL